MRRDASFPAFYLAWADLKRWTVPDFHWRIVHWLSTCTDLVRVLLVFRGGAKSTIYAVYKAYRLWRDPTRVSQVWAADDALARKLTRDTINVLRRHPWCLGMLPTKPGAQSFWVTGATDARNASMEAIGANSNATGSRSDAVDFDDIEVPKNIKTPDARQNLRNKISESTHIAAPGAQFTYIGTPHTANSIYVEQIEGGAAVLKIPLFEHVKRFEDTTARVRYHFDFPPGKDGLYVVCGIGIYARMMVEGRDYRIDGGEIVFGSPPGAVLDICAGCAWPERFTRADIESRRKQTRTLNAWDSQYSLEAKPISETRLDPNRMIPYEVEPRIVMANKQPMLMLGSIRLVGVKAWWDCSLGKIKSDASPLSVVFTDEAGRLYWHRSVGLVGDLDELDARGNLIGGQCKQLLDVLVPLNVPNVTVEVNGIGGMIPPILRRHAKRFGISVTEFFTTENKQRKILDAFEPPLSSRFLWAHTSVLDGPVFEQMQDFNPLATGQPDDYLDSGAGAITATPVRVGRILVNHGNPNDEAPQNWRPNSGVFEVKVDY